jgi:hypothetical protein
MVMETCEISGAGPEEEHEKITPENPDCKPEYYSYQDEGCEYAGACLKCPFPQCVYDTPHGRQGWLKNMRNKEIRKIYNSGKNVKELAETFGVSRRTVQRALDGK